jgi:predicted ArsR family transcriptional regulator
MATFNENDRQLIGILQKQGRKSVSELATLMKVTETAVRQRLTRLLAAELISREEVRLSRGRPNHMYSLTRKGRESAGQNFSDLATVVWDEVRAIEDVSIRSSVIQGIAKRLASKYKDEIGSLNLDPNDPDSVKDRANSIATFFESRGIPMTVDFAVVNGNGEENGENSEAETVAGEKSLLPVLNLHGCPYPGLSEKDDLICEMEQAMFSELAGCGVGFNRCDHKGGDSDCCSFQLEAKLPESDAADSQSPSESGWIKQLSSN